MNTKIYEYILIAFLVIGIVIVAFLVIGNTPTAPVQISIPVTWNPADISSPNVSVMVVRKTGDNPQTYEVERVISTTTPNLGFTNATTTYETLAPDEFIQVGCLDTPEECHALIIN